MRTGFSRFYFSDEWSDIYAQLEGLDRVPPSSAASVIGLSPDENFALYDRPEIVIDIVFGGGDQLIGECLTRSAAHDLTARGEAPYPLDLD